MSIQKIIVDYTLFFNPYYPFKGQLVILSGLIPSTDGSYSECPFDKTHSTSNFEGVGVLKFHLPQYDKFCNGPIKQDAAGCFLMLIDIINKG